MKFTIIVLVAIGSAVAFSPPNHATGLYAPSLLSGASHSTGPLSISAAHLSGVSNAPTGPLFVPSNPAGNLNGNNAAYPGATLALHPGIRAPAVSSPYSAGYQKGFAPSHLIGASGSGYPIHGQSPIVPTIIGQSVGGQGTYGKL
ncbi:unnamed protein product [Hermetia illucens]|uniref:Uncharacterized protein n=1 Tax=Hermetia illucens TaxID=343691 RepID=A0A7R8UHW9_HERIL|nr:uncharacterized protein LOC119649062 [Hermetia illucens]CAD7080918.1 unnamed protein product [Hermetia illucens]